MRVFLQDKKNFAFFFDAAEKPAQTSGMESKNGFYFIGRVKDLNRFLRIALSNGRTMADLNGRLDWRSVQPSAGSGTASISGTVSNPENTTRSAATSSA